ncbi:hypothetical protein RMATCC62417_13983 [Rhizopus microsporus]|nr:hypothetical protein RMATCC62417_13983 [Rhizopus microsporus]
MLSSSPPVTFDLAKYPTVDTIRLLASLLERMTAANDLLNKQQPVYTRFHARLVPSIDIFSYLSRILKYCPCANECFLSLLVYFDRMSKNALALTGKPFTIDSFNIHRLIIAGVMVASNNSLADVVTGKVNPSGRLPYTIAKKASDYPIKPDPALNVVYKEKLLMGYKWFDAHNVTPLFPFGHGMSYTSFAYSGLTVKVSASRKSIKVSVTVTIKNTGHLDGAEIPQLYLSFPESANEPPKLLRGFEKVFIKADKEEEVKFELTSTELSIWDSDSKSWAVPSGKFTAHVGASSRDIRQSADFVLLPGVQKHMKGPVLDRLVRSILSFFL